MMYLGTPLAPLHNEQEARADMKAIRIHKFGSTDEVLEYDEVPIPEPKADELLVKVEAASLNRADLGFRSGQYGVSRDQLPIVPGREFAGTVVETGAQIKDFRAGQRVVAYTLTGGYAEYAVAKPSQVRPVPDGVGADTAAAVPTAFLTAWFAVLEEARLAAGETMLVQAGSSGVGTAAIQIGKRAGATVITTTSTDEKAQRLGKLGADVVIDYTARPFAADVRGATGDKGVDVVLEMIGGDVYNQSLEVLAPGGRLVSLGGAFGAVPSAPPVLSDGRRAASFSITRYLQAHPEGFARLDTILDLIARKELEVVIGGRFPISEARAAQRALEGRDHFGKILLTTSAWSPGGANSAGD
jgi:NADPH2:quinone reductase